MLFVGSRDSNELAEQDLSRFRIGTANVGDFKIENLGTCKLTLETLELDPAYPNCKSKIEWMINGWKTDECYKNYGVDGSFCSFYNYLSKIENHCKPLEVHNHHEIVEMIDDMKLDQLFKLMDDNPTNFQWIKSRIQRLFNSWIDARNSLLEKNIDLKTRKKLNIVLYLGFLSKETGLKFGEKSAAGGPLGELVQWADLITSIYLLGHDMTISTEFKHFKDEAMKPYLSTNACPNKPGSSIDLIFTDIMGLRKMKKNMKNFFTSNKCRIRLLDSFGTHAEFNDANYFKEHWKEFGNKKQNPWGGHGLELQQFLTMYPHTDDNTFLGFVVETFEKDDEKNIIQRQNWTTIYGKEKYMWENCTKILEIIKEFTNEIHATVADSNENFMKEYNVINHGLLTTKEFHILMKKTKIFFGFGFPLEGPAPLEAVSNGAIFINHQFIPTKSRLTYKFFEDKPTLRELNSQNPYMERFIGEPHVLTVDINNEQELRKTMEKAMKINNEKYLPIEFSFEGMLERVDVLLTRHDFCGNEITNWPSWKSSKIIKSNYGQNCQDACSNENLKCERSFFKKINQKNMLKNFMNCNEDEITEESIPYAPGKCILQKNPQLFSCATKPPQNIQRLCPCRTFKKGQIVLCDKFC
uniref:Alpha-1,6-mannosyl-glycoprotein 6-beta-N-acetylglucosaminyltransferase n=2 Tax=Panagrolaimus sp. JU765 TaxID=591449 RepID=A0AC34R8H9_9BILA